MPVRHEDHTPPWLRRAIFQPGGGTQSFQPSPPFTTSQNSKKWWLPTHPFSKSPKLFTNRLPILLWQHSWRQLGKLHVPKTLGF